MKEFDYYGEHRFKNQGAFNIRKLFKEETVLQSSDQKGIRKIANSAAT